MIFDIVQNSKELFFADFDIIRGDQTIGQMSFQGKFGSMEGEWLIRYFDKEIVMKHCHQKEVRAKSKVFRPYSICINSDSVGFAYQTRFNAGIFKSFDYEQLSMLGTTYSLYSIGFGEDGFKCPIYDCNRQVALIEKPCIVYNDLHKYHIISTKNESDLAAVLLCGYMYVNSAYKPGNKVSNAIEKNISITKNKLLIDKYDSNFVRGVID